MSMSKNGVVCGSFVCESEKLLLGDDSIKTQTIKRVSLTKEILYDEEGGREGAQYFVVGFDGRDEGARMR